MPETGPAGTDVWPYDRIGNSAEQITKSRDRIVFIALLCLNEALDQAKHLEVISKHKDTESNGSSQGSYVIEQLNDLSIQRFPEQTSNIT